MFGHKLLGIKIIQPMRKEADHNWQYDGQVNLQELSVEKKNDQRFGQKLRVK